MTTLRLIKKGKVLESEAIRDHYDVYGIMKFLGNEEREKFYVLHLSATNKVMAMELISVGTLTQSLVCPREIFKGAVLNNSATIICVHNHPSGDVIPSAEDCAITRKLETAGNILGIPVLDHVIIGTEAVCSIKDYLEKTDKRGDQGQDLKVHRPHLIEEAKNLIKKAEKLLIKCGYACP